jgi:hypothetical protein
VSRGLGESEIWVRGIKTKTKVLLRQERKELAPLDFASIPIAKGKVGLTIPTFLMAFIKVYFFIYNHFPSFSG